MGYLREDNILEFAFVNADAIQKPIRGVVIDCHGLTDTTVHTSSPRLGVDLGKEGILYLWPYYGPWAWCNDKAIAYIDEVLDTVWQMYALGADCPLIVTGGSMGGLTSLLYSLFGKHKPIAVAANCPVCDLKKLFLGDATFRRTFYDAFVGGERTIEEELDRHDPLKNMDKLPDIPYLVVWGGQDPLITETAHIQPLREAMQRAGKQVTFYYEAGMGHCNIGDFKGSYETYLNFFLQQFGV